MRRYLLAAVMTFALTLLALIVLHEPDASRRVGVIPSIQLPTEPQTPLRHRPAPRVQVYPAAMIPEAGAVTAAR
jgi:hypothetical protein